MENKKVKLFEDVELLGLRKMSVKCEHYLMLAVNDWKSYKRSEISIDDVKRSFDRFVELYKSETGIQCRTLSGRGLLIFEVEKNYEQVIYKSNVEDVYNIAIYWRSKNVGINKTSRTKN